MTRIPEEGGYELVKVKQEKSSVFDLPEGEVIIDAESGLGDSAELVYLKPVDSKSKTRTEGDN